MREAELQAKEREIRLRELETEIYREQRSSKPEVSSVEPPLYATRKHNPPQSSIQQFGRKIVRIAKFTGFVVAGIAIIKVGFMVGMWITYLSYDCYHCRNWLSDISQTRIISDRRL